MIPATVYNTIRKALRASESLAQYLAERGYSEAGRDLAEIGVALEWVDSQQVIVTENELTELRALSESVGATVHEGLRWPPFGANGHQGNRTVEKL